MEERVGERRPFIRDVSDALNTYLPWEERRQGFAHFTLEFLGRCEMLL